MALITPLPHTVTRVAKISDPLELKYSEEEFGHVERDRGVCDESGDNGSCMDNMTGVCKSAVIAHAQTCIPHNTQ